MLIKSVILATFAAVPSVTALSGCYPAWQSGAAYSTGSFVSATREITTTTTSGTGSSAVTTTTTTYIKKNFKCTSGPQPSQSHCPSYDPSNLIQAGAAWADLGECSGTAPPPATPAPTPAPTYARWTGVGCPKEWASGASYEGGDLAEIDGVVYKCSTAMFVNAWCGQSNYKPGDSLYWQQAWTRLGSCVGTISPTTSPIYVALADAGGCPDEYVGGTTYEAGDKVAMKNIVYKCRSWPNSAWCGMNGYEPDGVNSKDAWTRLGYCDGTISPTTSPNFHSLTDAGGCPLDYSGSDSYEAGDKVSVEGNGAQKIVYQCKTFPDNGYCNQYEPGHWSKLGWKIVGYCEGTISPTKSPDFTKLTDHNGCPEEYSSGTNYEANDKVALPIDSVNSVVYKCSSDVHQSRYCSQYEPGNDYNLGWTLIAYCDGTMSPTTSPNFSRLKEVGDGCPKEYNVAITYKAGDKVSLFVSDTPDRAVVYECKAWPYGAYCNAGPNYAPDSVNANMGWALKGYCDGTISPTQAPIVYTPVLKCRWYNGTQAVTINNWSEGALSTYVAGTRVRKENRIYKCRGYPNSLWCPMKAYAPEESAYWADAWTKAGTCTDMTAPTDSPSISPTRRPSKSPTKKPTKSPTKFPTNRPSKSPTKKPTNSPTKFPTKKPTKNPSG